MALGAAEGGPMKLGIVGAGQEKFTPETEAEAKSLLQVVIRFHEPTLILSGHSPMGGVDLWAEELAAELGIPTRIHAPTRFTWGGPGGYKERNLAIAAGSDLVVCVVVRDYPPGFQGQRFETCYHCEQHGQDEPHVKSGGCWTAWKGRERAWITVSEAP